MTKTAIFLVNREVRTSRRGFQLWETTTEGSPISPFFKTIDELCAWSADNATVFGRETISASEWKELLARQQPIDMA